MAGLLSKVDIRGGEVVQDTFNVDFDKDFQDQIWELNEDLIQVHYNTSTEEKYILDLGWHPGNVVTNKSSFTVNLIRNENWETPVFTKKCLSEKEILQALNEAIGSLY